ncbi:MAG TPA: O-antigen ligase family protein [Candidatus Eisenbacteria bacterium]|nr:O-antigen ligase family protein [Candidatus Eisenbacteria bacterium]
MAVFTILALVAATAILIAPEGVALLGLAVLYLNFPGIAVTVHGLPSALAGASVLLLAGPLAVRLLRHEPLVVDRSVLLLFTFFGAVLLSTFVVQDVPEAIRWLTTFLLEGLLLYFVAVNLFRTPDRLRRALNVLVVCGAVLGGLTLYQEATRAYDRQFGGLAQRNLEFLLHEENMARDPFRPAQKIAVSNRAGGPVGEPNRYAQILLVLLPLAFFRARSEESRKVRIALLAGAALILAGVLLTYSRGGFVTVVVMAAILALTRTVRLRTLAWGAAALVLIVLVLAPGYVLRVATLQETPGLLEGTRESQSEEVMRSRLTEMLAAWSVFVDHPVVGVGPGQYAPVYSAEYMSDPDIAYKVIDRPRRAHNLYFELAAETGILGITTFLALVGWIQVKLWRAWRRLRDERPDLAGLALGFFVAIWGYLVSAVFLHLSYQRYYWLLLGLAAAALHVVTNETMRGRRIRMALDDLRGVVEPAR